jgi:serine/threonine protein kinase
MLSPFSTRDGTLIGTPYFMAPEQAEGRPEALDKRSDIFALGAILYNILTLRPPFGGTSEDEVLQKVKAGDIQNPAAYVESLGDGKAGTLPHLPGGQVPGSLSAVAMRALSFRSENRYQSVTEFQSEIVAYLPVSRRAQNRRVLADNSFSRSAGIKGKPACSVCACLF